MRQTTLSFLAGFLACLALIILVAAGSPSPTSPLAEREVYYPGSEALAPDEMRVVACATGMPNSRPKQAAACFLVELGNGDKFIFDIGSGSAERLSAMKIPYDYLDKVSSGISTRTISAPSQTSGSVGSSVTASSRCVFGAPAVISRSSARSMRSTA